MKKDELKKLYETMSNKDLAKKLGISEPTLTRHVKDAGILLKGKGRRKMKLSIREEVK